MRYSSKHQRQLIGIGCKQLGIDSEMKKAMLMEQFGHGHTTEISYHQADLFLKELIHRGFKITRTKYPNRPDIKRTKINKQALLEKIEALLADKKRPWNYAHAMAARICGVNRLEWCNAEELHKIVAALEYDARRRGRKRKQLK